MKLSKDYDIMCEMMDYIKSENILYISRLRAYAEKERANDWFVALRKRNNYRCLKGYINSRRYSKRGNIFAKQKAERKNVEL